MLKVGTRMLIKTTSTSISEILSSMLLTGLFVFQLLENKLKHF